MTQRATDALDAHGSPPARSRANRFAAENASQIETAERGAGEETRFWPAFYVLVETGCVDYFRPNPALPFTRRLKISRQATEKSAGPSPPRPEGRPLMNLRSNPDRWEPKLPDASDRWAIAKFGIGQPVLRTEDPKLVRGEGRFTDDVGVAGQAYAVMVRSRNAHGLIRAIDTAAARGDAGRARRLYRRRSRRRRLRHLQMHRAVQQPRRLAHAQAAARRRCRPTRCASSAIRSPAWWPRPCCRPRMRPRRSRSISIPCPRSPIRRRRCEPGAPLLYDDVPDNVALDYHYGDSALVAEAFARAAHVTRLQARQQPRRGQCDGAARRAGALRERALHALCLPPRA